MNATTSSVFQPSLLYSVPYSLFKSGLSMTARTIHTYAGPAVNTVGEGFNKAFQNNNEMTTATVISAVVFASLTHKGIKMLGAPFTTPWITIENRFKSEKKQKFELLDLSKLINNIASNPNPAAAVAQVRAPVAAAPNNEAPALAVPVAANTVLSRVSNAVLSRVANAIAPAQARVANGVTRVANAIAPAQARVANGVTRVVAATVNLARAVTPNNAAPARANPVAAPKNAKPAGTNYVISAKFEETKQDKDKTCISLPFSNDALVINHRKIKDALLTASGGAILSTTGALGLIDSTSRLIGASDTAVANLFGNLVANSSKLLATPLTYLIHSQGKVIGWVASANQLGYGVGNLASSVGLGYMGYKALQSTELVWFKYKKDSPNDPFLKRTNIYNKSGNVPVLVKDFAKVALGVSLMAGSILSANELFSANVTG